MMEELACRIQAIIKRSKNGSIERQAAYEFGNLVFDVEGQQLKIGNDIIDLTVKETRILDLLCANQGQIVKRSDALMEVYGKSDYFLGRSFDVFYIKLRKSWQPPHTSKLKCV